MFKRNLPLMVTIMVFVLGYLLCLASFPSPEGDCEVEVCWGSGRAQRSGRVGAVSVLGSDAQAVREPVEGRGRRACPRMWVGGGLGARHRDVATVDRPG